MHVLDIDLDFFLNAVAYNSYESRRLPSQIYKPWSVSRVRHFLERRCGLSTAKPLEGKIVYNHDKAFDFWQQLLETNKLIAPFDVTHIDGHSDLGLGDSEYPYLLSELLHYEPNERHYNIDRKRVKQGNYLAFAIACRWIKSIQWVRHLESGDDLFHAYFKSFSKRTGIIQLRSVNKQLMDNCLSSATQITFDNPPGMSFEPEVKYYIRVWKRYKSTCKFDYIVLSKSPDYTPVESDQLVPVISEYMKIK